MSVLRDLWRPIKDLADDFDGVVVLTDVRVLGGHVTVAEYDPPQGRDAQKAVRTGFVWRTPEGLYHKKAFTHFIGIGEQDMPATGDSNDQK